MNINWKLRFKNKVTLTSIILAVVALVYQVLGLLDIVPVISESEVVQVISVAIDLLVLMGVLVDPTTEGASDSAQAMDYTEPRK